MLKSLPAIVGVFALGAAVSADALPVTFDLGSDSSVKLNNFDGDWLCDLTGCGVAVSLNPQLGSLTKTLSAGQSWGFDFFTLSFYGLGGGSGSLSASLAFDAPTGAPDASGSATGSFLSFILTGGSLTWISQPGNFTLADGTNYSVFFENLSGITLSSNVNVRARLTLNREIGRAHV